MRRFKDRRKVISLTVVGVAYAMIVLPLIVNNLREQQDLRSRAQVAQPSANQELSGEVILQSSQSQCTAAGEVEIGVSYTNIDKTRSIEVTAKDEATGKTVALGTIAPEETKTATIPSGKNSVTASTVTFTVAYTDSPTQTEQKTASYEARTCQNALNQQAQVSADVPATCGNVTTDVVLIIDRSGSMGQANKLVQAKNAANPFTPGTPDILAPYIDIIKTAKDYLIKIALQPFAVFAFIFQKEDFILPIDLIFCSEMSR